MDRPVKRVLEKLRDCVKPHFPNDPDLKAAISAIKYMISMHTGSGVETYLTPLLRANINSNTLAATLSGSDCTFIMQLFNDVGPVSDA